MARLRCRSCGSHFSGDEFDYDVDMRPICPECCMADSAGAIAFDFECGHVDHALEGLANLSRGEPVCNPDGIVDKLVTEAGDLAAAGCVDDAMHRLRLAAQPKWPDIKTCQRQYDAAMAETCRAREAV